MKTYTFKIYITKDFGDGQNIDIPIVSIHCPLEVFYDSVKCFDEFKNLDGYITISDEVIITSDPMGIDDNGVEIFKDVYTLDKTEHYYGKVSNIYASNDLKEFLIKVENSKEV